MFGSEYKFGGSSFFLDLPPDVRSAGFTSSWSDNNARSKTWDLALSRSIVDDTLGSRVSDERLTALMRDEAQRRWWEKLERIASFRVLLDEELDAWKMSECMEIISSSVSGGIYKKRHTNIYKNNRKIHREQRGLSSVGSGTWAIASQRVLADLRRGGRCVYVVGMIRGLSVPAFQMRNDAQRRWRDKCERVVTLRVLLIDGGI